MIRCLTLALALVAATPAYAEADLGTALKPLWDFLDMVDRTASPSYSNPSSSAIMRSITPSPPCQNAGLRASRPKGASSSE
jgi:hypothetical protein